MLNSQWKIQNACRRKVCIILENVTSAFYCKWTKCYNIKVNIYYVASTFALFWVFCVQGYSFRYSKHHRRFNENFVYILFGYMRNVIIWKICVENSNAYRKKCIHSLEIFCNSFPFIFIFLTVSSLQKSNRVAPKLKCKYMI